MTNEFDRSQEKKEGGTEEASEGGIVWVHCPEHGQVIGAYLAAAKTYICPYYHKPGWGGPVDKASRDIKFHH